jgi:signal transduction histidine kinase
MKQKLIRLSQRYMTALQKHLKSRPRASLQPALRLGRQAVALGLETLELARIHEQALAELELSKSKDALIDRAEIFFSEAIAPIVETHRAARQSKNELNRLNGTLDRRTAELAATNRLLQRGITQRKSVEAALKKSGEHYARLLKESLQLQEDLRQLTHQVLAAQEDERKKISLELQNDIAQTLLGINVRLHSLKQDARANTKGLRNEIAGAQRLVAKSAKFVKRFARELDNPNEAHSDQFVQAL